MPVAKSLRNRAGDIALLFSFLIFRVGIVGTAYHAADIHIYSQLLQRPDLRQWHKSLPSNSHQPVSWEELKYFRVPAAGAIHCPRLPGSTTGLHPAMTVSKQTSVHLQAPGKDPQAQQKTALVPLKDNRPFVSHTPLH